MSLHSLNQGFGSRPVFVGSGSGLKKIKGQLYSAGSEFGFLGSDPEPFFSMIGRFGFGFISYSSGLK